MIEGTARTSPTWNANENRFSVLFSVKKVFAASHGIRIVLDTIVF